MGNDTINQATDGTIIPSSNHNSIRNALSVDLTPRNASGVVTDQAGSIGSSTYTWLGGYIQNMYALTKLWIGTISKNNTLETDGSDDIVIKRNNLEVGKFDSDGLTKGSIQPVGQQISSSSGSFSTASSSFVDVTNLSVTLTTVGRPVFISMIGDGSGSSSRITNSATGTAQIEIKIFRDTTEIAYLLSAADTTNSIMPSEVLHIDTPTSGTYTYKVQTRVITGTNVFVSNCKMIAYEMA